MLTDSTLVEISFTPVFLDVWDVQSNNLYNVVPIWLIQGSNLILGAVILFRGHVIKNK